MQRKALWFAGKRQESQAVGYARVRRQLVAALARSGFTVIDGAENYDDPAPPNVIQISHYQPLDKYRKAWHRRDGVDVAILYTTFESQNIPQAWVDAAPEFDAIWTTSQWAKSCYQEALRKAGVNVPVFVIHHGVDVGSFPAMHRPVRGGGSADPFTFLWKGQSPWDRKRGMLVAEAFKRIAIPQTRLLLKSQPHAQDRHVFIEIERGISSTSDYWTEEEMRAALFNADCFVQPTHAEGFGLEPLEAVATGLPALVTGWSGVTDYLFDGHDLWEDPDIGTALLAGTRFQNERGELSAIAVPLQYELGESFYNEEKRRVAKLQEDGKTVKLAETLSQSHDYGKDAHVSLDAMCEAMVFAYENRGALRDFTLEASHRVVHRRWHWGRGVRQVVESLRALGQLDQVSFVRQRQMHWIDDMRRARVGFNDRGPWASGIEPVDDVQVLDAAKILGEV